MGFELGDGATAGQQQTNEHHYEGSFIFNEFCDRGE
jgi:hypothetical protein